MKFHSLGYLFKEGVKSLWKNRTMTIASICVLISCLLLTGVAALASLNISAIMKSIEGTNSVRVILNTNVPTLTGIQFGEDVLRNIENISEYEYISREEGVEAVMDSLEEDQNLLSRFTGDDNSFFPAAYTITIKDLSLYDQTISEIIAHEDIVDSVSDYSNVASKLSNLDRLVKYASIGIVLILGVVSLFIISNTIKVTMFSRRMEINIMKSVGATNGFVRIPFIVEGIIIGILAGVISSTILCFAYEKIVEVFYTIVPFLTALDITPIIWFVYVVYIAAGMLFGIVGGGISIGKYLKKSGENAVN